MLNGKTALVTGGSRGIGRAVALKLAEMGANVAINYANNAQKAEEVVAEIKAMGREAVAIKADVSSFEEAEALISTTHKTFGSIDVLVNNAGITKDQLIIKMKEADWDQVIDTNLKGIFNCTKLTAKIMMKQRYGKIINMASVVGVIGNAGQSNYAAAKAGVIGFSKSIAKELGARNVNVNVVAPGYIKTDMTSVLNDGVKENLLTQIPLKRLGEAADVANLVGFLASGQADYITGQVINIDGGMVMA